MSYSTPATSRSAVKLATLVAVALSLPLAAPALAEDPPVGPEPGSPVGPPPPNRCGPPPPGSNFGPAPAAPVATKAEEEPEKPADDAPPSGPAGPGPVGPPCGPGGPAPGGPGPNCGPGPGGPGQIGPGPVAKPATASGESRTLEGPVGPGPGGPQGNPCGAPDLNRGFLNKVWQFTAKADGIDEIDGKRVLNVTVKSVENLPKRFKDDFNEIKDEDAYVIFKKLTRVFKGDEEDEDSEQLSSKEALEGLNRATKIVVRAKLARPEKWMKDEDGNPVTTLNAKSISIIKMRKK